MKTSGHAPVLVRSWNRTAQVPLLRAVTDSRAQGPIRIFGENIGQQSSLHYIWTGADCSTTLNQDVSRAQTGTGPALPSENLLRMQTRPQCM